MRELLLIVSNLTVVAKEGWLLAWMVNGKCVKVCGNKWAATVLPLIMNAYTILADIVVVAHLSYVLFVVLGLCAIFLGYLLGWRWVRNPWFRLIHGSMIAAVVIESLLSISCPLTTLEIFLRNAGGQSVRGGSFVGRLAHDFLFYDFSPEFFTIAYCLFGALVLLSWVLVPPTHRRTQSLAANPKK